MSENKRRKMDGGAACSSVDGGEPHIAQQIAMADYRAGSRSPDENEEKRIFNPSLSEFREAVKWSGFVDRTLLIKQLLSKKHNTFVMIFAPRRFGKSMNVSMVERFFEIEKNRNVTEAPQDLKELEIFENFNAFNRYEMKQPCKILAEEDLVKEHFGRHPVVHMDVKDIDVTSIESVKNGVKRLVRNAYFKHFYLTHGKIFPDSSDNEDANKHCRIWCDPKEYKNEEAIDGLQKLIEYLHAYHKRKVFLLVDEFDAPAVNALLERKSGDEVREVSSQVAQLVGAVVEGEVADQHLLGSLITGVSYLGSIGISDALNNVLVYKWLSKEGSRFSPYYGLTENELKILVQHVCPNQEEERASILKEVKHLYNGYRIQRESLYCLWSVLHYVQARLTLKTSNNISTTFWARSSIISKMGSVLKNSKIVNDIMILMGGGSISLTSSLTFCEKVNAENLAEVLSRDTSHASEGVVFSFFMEQGYLTLADQQENVPSPCEQIHVKIPNEEVSVAFKAMFKHYCTYICGLNDSVMYKCAEVFKDLPTNRDDKKLKDKLRNVYDLLVKLFNAFRDPSDLNERAIQAVLYTTMLKVEIKECSLDKYVKGVDSDTGKIDLLLRNDIFTAIFELKFCKSDRDRVLEESAGEALEEILSGGKTKKVPCVKIFDDERYPVTNNYVLIGFTMSDKGKICMCCLVNSQDDKDCIFFPSKSS